MSSGRIAIAAAFYVAVIASRSVCAQCAPDTLLANIPNPTPASFDTFGIAVAISGNIAVVGENQDDPGGVTDAGTAHVINATTGAPVAVLNDPSPAVLDGFGGSVAISGNLAVIGVPADDPGGVTDAGRAYVFDASTGTLLATLNNPSPTAYDNFGCSVAISGNLAVVGAYQDDPGFRNNAGSAYVFNATTGALIWTLTAPVLWPNDNVGYSVAISGNVIVVGAPAIYAAPPAPGFAYVFDTATGLSTATLISPLPSSGDRFGGSVAVSGNAAVVGAPMADPGGLTDAGSAFVFNAATGALATTLGNPAPAMNMIYGGAVAISGNVAVIGSSSESSGGFSLAGKAFVFDAATGALDATLAAPSPATFEFFGYSVAVSGNIALVGAPMRDPAGVQDAGAAFTFTCNPPTLSPTPSPSDTPTPTETSSPTESPSPTSTPTESPSPSPTSSPAGSPTPSPTSSPAASPTLSPTLSPAGSPTPSPTLSPSPGANAGRDWALYE